MTRYWLSVILIFLLFEITKAQTVDNVGSGRTMQFDGVDDYIDLGNIYDDLKFPITVSAWIYLDGNIINWAPIFVSQDNAPVYNGFWFLVQPTTMAVGYGDGLGENDPAFRRGKSVTFSSIANRWTHVAAVIRGATDMDLFVNGINVGGSYAGSSNSPMSASNTDVAKIGYWYSNGQITRFKGKLDEVRVWNSSLNQDDLRASMCKKLTGNEPGLIGYWTFDETTGNSANDKSPRGHNGTLKGNPTRSFSGAPIGETSKYDYRSTWTGIIAEMADGDVKLMISNIKGNPEGVHLYKVSSEPSQKGNLSGNGNKPYFGVFMASLDNSNTFDVAYTSQSNAACKTYTRYDNSMAAWTETALPVKDVLQRGEYIKSEAQSVEKIDLGEDKVFCNTNTATLNISITNPLLSIVWNTGQTSSSITVSSSGKYWVKVTGGCSITSDTVSVSFLKPPVSFSLGNDKEVCPFVLITLKPYGSSGDYQYVWQDGSTGDSFIAKDYGTYYVTVKNLCGELKDSITFSTQSGVLDLLPNVITPNGDLYNEFFDVASDQSGPVSLLIVNRWGKQVYFSANYKNDWNGADLSSGVYFYKITGNCIRESKGTVSILK